MEQEFFSPESLLPVWQRFGQIDYDIPHTEPIVIQGELSCDLGMSVPSDLRGMLSRNEAWLTRNRIWVSNWIGEIACLKYADHWNYSRRFLQTLIVNMFRDSARNDFPAFVVVESCRDKVTRQNHHTTVKPSFQPSVIEWNGTRKMNYNFFRTDIPIDFDHLYGKEGRPHQKDELLFLVNQHRKIVTPSGQNWSGVFRSLCIGNPEIDSEVLRWGRIPASSTPDIAHEMITISRLVCIIRVLARTNSPMIKAYTVEFHPYFGSILAIRYCEIPLGMLCVMHPRWASWIEMAMRRRKT